MPRNGSGTYSLPQPPFVAGTTISSAAVNSDLSDIAAALTGSLPRDGQAGMIGQFKSIDGSTATPSISFLNEPTSGFYRVSAGVIGVSILGTNVATINSSGILGLTPIGGMIDFSGGSAPTLWLLCFGQAVSRTTYAALFAVIGTTWGSGDGSTTFNVPDLRGRIGVGNDAMGGTPAGRLTTPFFGSDPTILTNAGGQQSSTLISANLPAYTPTGSIVSTDGGHAHGYLAPNSTPNETGGGVFATTTAGIGATTNTGFASITSTFTGVAQGGTSTAFSNIQPSVIVTKIIFAGA